MSDIIAKAMAKQGQDKITSVSNDVKSRGVSLLDFSTYKTSTANGTDWTPAFIKALDFLSTSTEIKKLSIPAQTFTCLNIIPITSKHNGITIEGEGFGTELKILDGATQNWLFNLYDSALPVKGVTIRNLQLNGNKANLSNTGTTGFGIFAQQGTGIANENIIIQNIWAHDFLTTGVNVHSSNTMVSNIFSWSNGFHGVTTANAKNIMLSNLWCSNNGGYGIDISGGEVILNTFYATGNVSGGMKASVSQPTINLRAINGRLNNNIGVGFQTTQSNGATFFFDNIEANDNGGAGFLVSEGDVCIVGKLTALRNNTSVGSNTAAAVSFKIPAQIDTLITSDNTGYGLSVDCVKEVHIKRLLAERNSNYGVYLSKTEGSVLTIGSGSIIDNTGTYGINVGNNPNKLTVYNTVFGDTRTTKTQTRAAFLGSGSDVTFVGCDMTQCISTPKLFDNGVASLNVRDNKGYLTQNYGTKSFSPNGVTTQFVIPHGLVTTPSTVNVTPLTAASNPQGMYVTFNTTNIVITFATAPASGTDTLNYAWEAKYKK
ncbi:hypothetical protein WKH56_20955 [Priestia sp. SB1]|uniref:hypothetical protein n=1 Tax=Priestia sp. SB1 TaxID=3132359 RepID=UPI00317388B3